MPGYKRPYKSRGWKRCLDQVEIEAGAKRGLERLPYHLWDLDRPRLDARWNKLMLDEATAAGRGPLPELDCDPVQEMKARLTWPLAGDRAVVPHRRVRQLPGLAVSLKADDLRGRNSGGGDDGYDEGGDDGYRAELRAAAGELADINPQAVGE